MSRADDRFAIQDVLFRYARAVDRLDYDAIAACYFDDAVDVHGGYTGDAAGLVEDIRARHRTIDSSQHFISNVLVEFTGEHSGKAAPGMLQHARRRPVFSQPASTAKVTLITPQKRRIMVSWRVAPKLFTAMPNVLGWHSRRGSVY